MTKKWFAAKKYGWGWYPSTWQGWSILGIYSGFLIYRAFVLDSLFDTTTSYLFRFFFEMAFATIILVVICYITGEKPRWRWGK